MIEVDEFLWEYRKRNGSLSGATSAYKKEVEAFKDQWNDYEGRAHAGSVTMDEMYDYEDRPEIEDEDDDIVPILKTPVYPGEPEGTPEYPYLKTRKKLSWRLPTKAHVKDATLSLSQIRDMI